MSEGLRTVTVSGFSPLVKVTVCCGTRSIRSQPQLLLEQPNRGKSMVLPPRSVFLPRVSVGEYLVTLNTSITVSNV